MFHIQHASKEFKNIVCVSDDTDVMVLCMYVNARENFPAKIYLKRSFSRLIDVQKLNSAVGKDVANALVGLHAFTGCDTVSAFSGKGKVNPLKLASKNEIYISLFANIGTQLYLSEDTFSMVQQFTCDLYSRGTKIKNINKLRYNMFRSKKGKLDSAQLPPCENTLRLHTQSKLSSFPLASMS